MVLCNYHVNATVSRSFFNRVECGGLATGGMGNGNLQVQRHIQTCALMGVRNSPLTPMAKYSVNAMVPKYTAVKGRRGPEIRCWAYVIGPRRTAHDVRNSNEPMDHLSQSDKILSAISHTCLTLLTLAFACIRTRAPVCRNRSVCRMGWEYEGRVGSRRH